MAQQPLEIHVKKGVGTAEATRTPTSGEVVPQLKQETSALMRATQAHLIRAGQDVIMLGINKTSDLTGNYSFAHKTNNALAIAGVIGTFAATGPAVGGIMIGGQALTSALTAGIDNYVEVRNINFNNERLGRISRAGSDR